MYKIKEENLIQNGKTVTKIGIQANPFTYFLINGEPIRVGRNGIYELQGININSLYAVPLSADNFIIDYLYN